MAKFGINDILNAKTKAAGKQVQTEDYKEIYLSPYEVKVTCLILITLWESKSMRTMIQTTW